MRTFIIIFFVLFIDLILVALMKPLAFITSTIYLVFATVYLLSKEKNRQEFNKVNFISKITSNKKLFAWLYILFIFNLFLSFTKPLPEPLPEKKEPIGETTAAKKTPIANIYNYEIMDFNKTPSGIVTHVVFTNMNNKTDNQKVINTLKSIVAKNLNEEQFVFAYDRKKDFNYGLGYTIAKVDYRINKYYFKIRKRDPIVPTKKEFEIYDSIQSLIVKYQPSKDDEYIYNEQVMKKYKISEEELNRIWIKLFAYLYNDDISLEETVK